MTAKQGPRVFIRSKAVWGYDPEFMALMPAALGVAGEDIAAGDVWVATGADGQMIEISARRLTACSSSRARSSVMERRHSLQSLLFILFT